MYRQTLPDLSNPRLKQFKQKVRKPNNLSEKRDKPFPGGNESAIRSKMADEYCWAITQATGRVCCGRSGSGVSEFRFQLHYLVHSEPGSSVGIVTGYGLDGPGIESRWGRDFPHLSRPALGPTQLPVQWVTDISRG